MHVIIIKSLFQEGNTISTKTNLPCGPLCNFFPATSFRHFGKTNRLLLYVILWLKRCTLPRYLVGKENARRQRQHIVSLNMVVKRKQRWSDYISCPFDMVKKSSWLR